MTMAFVLPLSLQFRLFNLCLGKPSSALRKTVHVPGSSRFSFFDAVKEVDHHPNAQMATASTMTMKSKEDGQLINKVLNFWFGKTEFSPFDTLKSQIDLWYGGSKETDDYIRNNFGTHVQRALNDEHDDFIGHPEFPVKSELALIVMLDQFPRNIYRGTALSFAGDAKSRDIVHNLMKSDRWKLVEKTLPVVVRMSFLLPLMHQETLSDHDVCIGYIKDMIEQSEAQGEKAKDCVESLKQNLDFAHQHRALIEKFGRYPYRNKVLGRQNTEEEEEFLKDGPRFGQ